MAWGYGALPGYGAGHRVRRRAARSFDICTVVTYTTKPTTTVKGPCIPAAANITRRTRWHTCRGFRQSLTSELHPDAGHEEHLREPQANPASIYNFRPQSGSPARPHGRSFSSPFTPGVPRVGFLAASHLAPAATAQLLRLRQPLRCSDSLRHVLLPMSRQRPRWPVTGIVVRQAAVSGVVKGGVCVQRLCPYGPILPSGPISMIIRDIGPLVESGSTMLKLKKN